VLSGAKILQQVSTFACGFLVSNSSEGSRSMARELRFRTVLPVAELAVAALFGGIGLWQRSVILSRSLFGQTLWESTARFHVWPWPYKFAAVSNLPALVAGLLLTIPISAMKPTLPEALQLAPALLFVLFLWYWVGARLDRRWSVSDKTPWIALLVFTLVSLAGAIIPLGYVGYLPYGFTVWMLAAVTISRRTYRYFGMPVQGSSKALRIVDALRNLCTQTCSREAERN
jgi:nitrate reductase NapE component